MTRSLWTGGLVLSVAGGVIALSLWLGHGTDGMVSAVAWGTLLFFINMILDTFFLIKSLKNDADSFVKRFFRGKLVRVVIVLMIFFTIWVFVALNRFIFVVTFFILYFLFQIIEIYILHKHNSKRS